MSATKKYQGKKSGLTRRSFNNLFDVRQKQFGGLMKRLFDAMENGVCAIDY
jgi:hypothetical protein